MSKNSTSNPLPWIRTKEVIRLIADECSNDLQAMDDRLLFAFAAGLIRCQAGSAIFETAESSIIKRNWPVHTSIWQMPSGDLSLSSDRFIVSIAGSCSPALQSDPILVGVRSLTLLELKTHEVELRRHFQLRQKPKRHLEAKSNVITKCKEWLRTEFHKDSTYAKKKKDFSEAAIQKFGSRLAERGFLSAWQEVTSETEHRARSAPGRPRGS